jgi:UDP-N-acetylglucosamine 2-epimerase (non-hydrolysing)
MTGNTIVDALQAIEQSHLNHPLPIPVSPERRLILVTAHRRENFGEPLANICAALKRIVELHKNVDIIYPVHLNPNIRDAVYKNLSGIDRIHLIAPVDYLELVTMMKRAYIVLTDSGGIQEEAPSFGKPALVMRMTTERPEGVEAGVAKLVGTDTSSIVNEVSLLLQDDGSYAKMARSVNPYGDGNAAVRIVKELYNSLAKE